MHNDYNLLLKKLKGRRYDEALREYVLSDAFKQSAYTECLLYALESMQEIDPAYAYKVYANSRKIHEQINKSLKKKGYHIDFRYQGALKTHSNILLYGDVEIIVIKKNVSEKPRQDIQTLAMDLIETLRKNAAFKSVDYSDKTRIRITAQKPTCEIDILPSMWVDSAEYVKTKNEIYRGIAEFDFKNKKVKKYLPFLNIARINARDRETNGNLHALIRLLKTLRDDSKERIDLRESEINAILYNIPASSLEINRNKILTLLPTLSDLLRKLSTDSQFFQSLLSPAGKDRVFAGHPEKQADIKKMNESLSQLIADITDELKSKGKSLDSEIIYF